MRRFPIKSDSSRGRSRGFHLLLGVQSFITLAISYYTVTNVSILYSSREEGYDIDVFNNGFNDTVIASAASSSSTRSTEQDIDSTVKEERVKSELSTLREETIQKALQEAEERMKQKVQNEVNKLRESTIEKALQEAEEQMKQKVQNEGNKLKESTIEKALQEVEEQMKQKVQNEVNKLKESTIEKALQEALSKQTDSSNEKTTNMSPRFVREAQFFGMARIPNHDFLQKFDFGIPIHPDTNRQTLLLYNNKNAMPTSIDESTQRAIENEDENGIPLLTSQSATENCTTVNVVNYKEDVDCVALVKNFENYHVQRWEKDDDTADAQFKVTEKVHPHPYEHQTNTNWGILRTYFESYDELMTKLKPIAKKVAVNNTIIVLTCNEGQSELLMNFVCNCRAKGLDTSHILVFATDEETNKLAEDMGLASFYDEKNIGKIVPKGEARAYGDNAFGAIMFAKVISVQLINKLGYDLLFQDVDVTWYKNPLDYFVHNNGANNKYPDFDMYFQDDGNRQFRFSPYYANSGFYFVRSNEKTKHFFTSLLYQNDLILRTRSHQHVLTRLMSEHATSIGLKVKVFDKSMTKEFPGGYHYHIEKERMKEIVKNETSAHIFHMSWTTNKDNKLKFIQQMGEWYLKDTCIRHIEEETVAGGEGSNETVLPPEISYSSSSCCLVEANVTCHYRDKPSIIPCTDSDPIDEGKPSFW